MRTTLVALTLTAAIALSAGPASARTLHWSGQTWQVGNSSGAVGPGPNHFSDDHRNVWVDDRGWLHVAITHRHGEWQCAEISATHRSGYGDYRFRVQGDAQALDPNVVLGLFTWDGAAGDHHRELDIEWSRWADPSDPKTAGFTVQPYQHQGNGHRYVQPSSAPVSDQTFTWHPATVAFGAHAVPGSAISRWTYRGPDVPAPGNAHVHLNLWLFRGAAPTDQQPSEIVIRSFTFHPA
ncbi:MAG: hypothetical protein QOI52_1846 [Chloroflexota bacterium]|nr:hypothetical protein [Chloroflexota bacterium]